MSAELWRELSLLGHWIGDAVIVRWAALTERIADRQGLRSGDVLPLLLARPEPDRVTALARAVYIEAKVDRCVWSKRSLVDRTFAVDHVIPFALWGNNDLWNLMPAHPAVNGQKSDKLPHGDLLAERRQEVLENWGLLRQAMPEAFDHQSTNLLGSRPAATGQWADRLFDRMREAVEVTALQRGIERWKPGERC